MDITELLFNTVAFSVLVWFFFSAEDLFPCSIFSLAGFETEGYKRV